MLLDAAVAVSAALWSQWASQGVGLAWKKAVPLTPEKNFLLQFSFSQNPFCLGILPNTLSDQFLDLLLGAGSFPSSVVSTISLCVALMCESTGTEWTSVSFHTRLLMSNRNLFHLHSSDHWKAPCAWHFTRPVHKGKCFDAESVLRYGGVLWVRTASSTLDES